MRLRWLGKIHRSKPNNQRLKESQIRMKTLMECLWVNTLMQRKISWYFLNIKKKQLRWNWKIYKKEGLLINKLFFLGLRVHFSEQCELYWIVNTMNFYTPITFKIYRLFLISLILGSVTSTSSLTQEKLIGLVLGRHR
jgi:hypothetical protein